VGEIALVADAVEEEVAAISHIFNHYGRTVTVTSDSSACYSLNVSFDSTKSTAIHSSAAFWLGAALS
jgi:hypothetical protein